MWFTRVSIANPVFATMVMAALCVLGLLSYAQLGVERLPDVSPPTVYLSIGYPGVSPETIEVVLTQPVELAINGIAGVSSIRSTSVPGRSEVIAEFGLDVDMVRAVQEVRDKVAALQPRFPREVNAAYISRIGGENTAPAAIVAMIGPGRSGRELSLLAEQTVRKRFERVNGVAKVDVGGLTTRQIRIDLDPQRLQAHQLTPADVSEALKRANADGPVGLLSDAREEALVRVDGRVRDPKAFADLVVARRGNLVVRLGDLGTLVEGEREPDSIARVDGTPAVSFFILKQQDANLVVTGDGIREAIDEMRQSLPPGIELRLILSGSDAVRDALTGVKHTVFEGALLTVAIVFLFLRSWRSTVITALTLPIAVISTFIVIHAFGFTLNFMTLMALSLSIGLLIDDAIVVRENIVRHLGMGKAHRRAATEGTEEIGLAVMATTFAICAVFVPVAFMKGQVGKFFFPFGVTVAAAVLVSLFVSFTLDPMLSSVWKDPAEGRWLNWPVVGSLMRGTERLVESTRRLYERGIGWIFGPSSYRAWLPVPRRRDGRWSLGLSRITPRGIVLWLALAILGATIFLASRLGTEFVPPTDGSFIPMFVYMPVGTSLDRANEKMIQVESMVRTLPEVRAVISVVGDLGSGVHNGSILNMVLAKPWERHRTQSQVEDAIRAGIATIPGASVSFANRPVAVTIMGPDPTVLEAELAKLQEKLSRIPGVTDLDSSVKPGLPGYAISLRPTASRELGLTPTDLAASLRPFVNGDPATYWTAPDGEQIEVQLRLPRALRQDPSQLEQLPIAFARDGSPIPLARVAELTPVASPGVIRRLDLQRRETIQAGVSGRPVGDVDAEIQHLVGATVLPPGYRFDLGGQGRDQKEANRGIQLTLGAAVLFIYMVLASQFGSFVQPLAIMASLPLSLIGVVLALLLTNGTINLFSMIGLVMLMGLVTKNAILLVDHANQVRREQGAGVVEALRQAGSVRIRPILMTTAAMVFGMLPMALALNEGGEIEAPMGRAIIGGVLSSTVLTLVVVPVLYSYLVYWEMWITSRTKG